MSLLAYAITEEDTGAIEGVGLDGRPLIAVGHEGVALVVSHQESGPPEPTPQTLLRYEEIVEQLMGRQPILPARFGSMLTDEDEARSAIRDRRDELRCGLERVRGAVELGIRGSWANAPTQPPARSGTEYLLGQLDLRRRAQRAADLVDPLRAIARSSRVKLLPRPSVPFLAAYLVDRDRTEEFIALVRELGPDFEDIALELTGPWPPYSFAQAATLDRGRHRSEQ
jgi:hypothetical protein